MKKDFIMYIEDDIVETMKFKQMWTNHCPNIAVLTYSDAADAFDYLKNKVTKLPKLLVVDLNMPGINGFEFIEMIRNDQRLHTVPIIILTSSSNPSDIDHAHNQFISGYFEKTFDINEYSEQIKHISSYWELSR